MRNLLAPLGFAYGEIAGLRRKFYSSHILKSEKLARPVVSVGNLTVGGTGKTPLVDAILQQIESGGKSACVLTRGYGRENSETSVILDSASPTALGGDEPVWLARRPPQKYRCRRKRSCAIFKTRRQRGPLHLRRWSAAFEN